MNTETIPPEAEVQAVDETKGRVQAELVALSFTKDDDKPSSAIATLRLKYPMFLEPALREHARLIVTSMSLRALPLEIAKARVQYDPFVPFAFGRECPGMVTEQGLDAEAEQTAGATWVQGVMFAVATQSYLAKSGVHKQHANLPLAPYLWQESLLTGSAEALNEFMLARTSVTEPLEMQVLAQAVHAAVTQAMPEPETFRSWHLPFGGLDPADIADVRRAVETDCFDLPGVASNAHGHVWEKARIEISWLQLCALVRSVGRCARVTFGDICNERPLAKDFDIGLLSIESGHMRHCAHQAVPSSFGASAASWARGGLTKDWLQFSSILRTGELVDHLLVLRSVIAPKLLKMEEERNAPSAE